MATTISRDDEIIKRCIITRGVNLDGLGDVEADREILE
jgi:hypothetical protein